MSRRSRQQPVKTHPFRHWSVALLVMAGLGGLFWRAAILQTTERAHLEEEGRARFIRDVPDLALRGRILDRHGEPLAMSTAVDSVWADPKLFCRDNQKWGLLSKQIGIDLETIRSRCEQYGGRRFMWIRRHLRPSQAAKILDSNIPGIALRREYRRFYPSGAASSHVLGFTDIDEVGQEGLEKSFQDYLAGRDGLKRLWRDRSGRIIDGMEIDRVVHGRDLVTTLDIRLQSLLHSELSRAVSEHQASAGMAVILEAQNGEVLAITNHPKFNPNNRAEFKGPLLRNRSLTDPFEPGSTMKPFTIAMALSSGELTPETLIETSPGWWRVGNKTISDVHDYGTLSVSGVVVKSSNIGAAKIAMQFPPEELRELLAKIGFGSRTGIELSGESAGRLPKRRQWRLTEHATLGYGYGFSVTALQLAQAYQVLANDGLRFQPTLISQDQNARSKQVLSAEVTREVRAMLRQVVTSEGTARRARVVNYAVAGKTGTTKKIIDGQYADRRYIASFAGFAPANKPRFVMVVVIDDPKGEHYYGGRIAAPVFSKVMTRALHLFNVPPQPRPSLQQTYEVVDASY
ncbi:MAG: penicillin-binding protein 2 [Arenicellales bacterium]|nr:penicillin-binding protein 2 [Arenicellales bacterium]MDP7482251.1 penicillin-binding protein 2 [Arenicellales bacterium]